MKKDRYIYLVRVEYKLIDRDKMDVILGAWSSKEAAIDFMIECNKKQSDPGKDSSNWKDDVEPTLDIRKLYGEKAEYAYMRCERYLLFDKKEVTVCQRQKKIIPAKNAKPE